MSFLVSANPLQYFSSPSCPLWCYCLARNSKHCHQLKVVSLYLGLPAAARSYVMCEFGPLPASGSTNLDPSFRRLWASSEPVGTWSSSTPSHLFEKPKYSKSVRENCGEHVLRLSKTHFLKTGNEQRSSGLSYSFGSRDY